MDDFLEPFLSTTSWTDANLHESSSWDNSAASQLDGILSDRLSAYGRNNSKLNSCIIPSDHIISSLHNPETNIDVQINSSIFLNPSLKYGLVSDDNQQQRDIQDPIPIQDKSDNGRFERQHSFPLVMDDGMSAGSFDPNNDSVLRKGCEESMYFQSFVDSHSNSTMPQLWQSYSTDPGLDMGQSGLQGLALHGNFHSNSGILGKGSTNQELLQLSSFSRSLYENGTLPNSHLPSYIPTSVGMNIANSIGIQNNQQQSNGDTAKNLAGNAAIDVANPGGANVSGSNGVTKPRARARRGQATDPHSIAERLRREKIAERMKNLQELVPNSNKTDKASMLDEIIEYVKFLQLQVKVLSMSRLGAAGAVVPLIADIQSSGSRNLLFTSSADADLSETQEIVAFEQEVVKLMESNITAAMQFLQTKGLCLMPVALASAISARKGSMAAIPPKKSDGMVHSTISRGDEMSMKDIQEGEHAANGCNRAAAKEEETKKSGNLRNLKSKA